jgi:hypothetical protein
LPSSRIEESGTGRNFITSFDRLERQRFERTFWRDEDGRRELKDAARRRRTNLYERVAIRSFDSPLTRMPY